jgi:hypothetical protein
MAEFYTDPNFWIAVTAVIGVIIAILKLNKASRNYFFKGI